MTAVGECAPRRRGWQALGLAITVVAVGLLAVAVAWPAGWQRLGLPTGWWVPVALALAAAGGVALWRSGGEPALHVTQMQAAGYAPASPLPLPETLPEPQPARRPGPGSPLVITTEQHRTMTAERLRSGGIGVLLLVVAVGVAIAGAREGAGAWKVAAYLGITGLVLIAAAWRGLATCTLAPAEPVDLGRPLRQDVGLVSWRGFTGRAVWVLQEGGLTLQARVRQEGRHGSLFGVGGYYSDLRMTVPFGAVLGWDEETKRGRTALLLLYEGVEQGANALTLVVPKAQADAFEDLQKAYLRYQAAQTGRG